MKILSRLSFTIFAFLYLATASTLALPMHSILRWVGSGFLLLCVFIEMRMALNDYKIFVPNAYNYIYIALIPTLLGVAGEGTIYSIGRIISFFLVVFSLQFFFDIKSITKEDVKALIEIFVFISGVMICISVFTNNIVQDRLAGVYANANQLSCISLFCAIMSLCYFLVNKGKPIRGIYLLFLCASTYCTLKTASRMGTCCIILISFLIPFITNKNKSVQSRLKQLFSIVMIVCVVLFVVNKFEIAGIDRLFQNSNDNDKLLIFTRGETWNDVYNIWHQKPLLGWGYGQVSYHVFELKDTTYNWGVHSSYFAILCEMGIVGSLLFLSFFISYGLYIAKQLKAALLNESEKLFVRFLILICIIMLINAYSESYLFSLGNPMAACFWVPFIALNCYLRKQQKIIVDR